MALYAALIIVRVAADGSVIFGDESDAAAHCVSFAVGASLIGEGGATAGILSGN